MTTTRNRLSSESRQAITLLELIIAIAVFGILISVLLVSIQRAAEASRRMSCTNKLKQIVAAAISYEGTHGCYPPALLSSEGVACGNNYSPQAAILPFLDEYPTYDQINYSLAHLDFLDSPRIENLTVRNTSVKVYLCPSDSNTMIQNRCSYRANFGLYPFGDGPFRYCRPVKNTDIRRAHSNVAFFSERFAGSGFTSNIDTKLDVALAIGHVSSLQPRQLKASCEVANKPSWYTRSGEYWLYLSTYHTSYNHNGTPNESTSSCEFLHHPQGLGGFHPPRSNHVSGVNVAFGDGRVAFIADAIDRAAWFQMSLFSERDDL